MQVRSDREGVQICAQLRAAGIKCAVEPLPDRNSIRAVWGGRAPTVLVVLVNESDMDSARAVVTAYQSNRTGHEVSVCESRSLGDDPERVGSGFEATCECGWTGPLRDTSDEAFADARGHSSSVSSVIVRAD